MSDHPIPPTPKMSNLTRHHDWRGKMHNNIMVASMLPFEWGSHDCAKFAARHVEAITGVDLYEPFEGTYSTAFGALKSLKVNGYDSLLDLCQQNFRELPNMRAQVGDLAIIRAVEEATEDEGEVGTGWAIGVYLGELIGVLSPQGYGRIARLDPRVVYSFAVGHSTGA